MYYKETPIIIFDLGNVLVDVNISNIHKACEDLGFTDGTFDMLNFNHCIDGLCNFGIMDVLPAIDMIYGHKRGTTISAEEYDAKKIELRKVWCSEECVTPNKEIIDYFWSLLYKSTKCNFEDKIFFMFASNLGKDHHNYIKKFHLCFRHKHVSKVLSYEVGSVKPQALFFKVLKDEILSLKTLEGRDLSILYIDDRPENLSAFEKHINFCNVECFNYNSNWDAQSKAVEKIHSFIESCKGPSYDTKKSNAEIC